MARLAREDVFSPDEVAVVHVMNRVVRRCFLMGDDELTGKNFDHRKQWIEEQMQRQAACFGIDLLCFAVMSNHFHQVLRSRPDVVATWNKREVARRWLMLCPKRKHKDGTARDPSEAELNAIINNEVEVAKLRRRLSDISWWMRLLCQRIAQSCNAEDGMTGKFWESRFRAVRLIDEESLLACAAYVDLNPIRAALAETLETSDHTSVQLRWQTLQAQLASAGASAESGAAQPPRAPDAFLAPLEIDERRDPPGPRPSGSGRRCSDKGFLAMPLAAYLELLDWTARQLVTGKRGATPEHVPALFERLKLNPEVWYQLVTQFGRLFSLVAGRPQQVDTLRSRRLGRRFHMRSDARKLLSA